jgi:hypothetical protein
MKLMAQKITNVRLFRGALTREQNPANGAVCPRAHTVEAACAAGASRRFLEPRAPVCMARLCRDHGKRDEARELLAPVYGWLTEVLDTRDLKEAKALLDDWPRDRR